MNIVSTDKAPAAIGPYSQAVRTQNLLFCSGQIGIDPAKGKLAGNDLETQTKQIFKNIRAVLAEAGLSLSDVVKTTVFITNISQFPKVNEIYGEEFGDHRPARSTVEVSALPMNSLIEIEVIASCE